VQKTKFLKGLGAYSTKVRGKRRDTVSIIEKYEKVRKAGRTFVYTVLRACVNKKMMMESAKLLGLHLRGKEIWFDCEEETNVLMDFLVFDYKMNGKNAVQAYRQ
jgi:hypothetical protein